MRTMFHAELAGLMTSLATMTRLTGQMMTNASIALHQTDCALAALVIAECDQLARTLASAERHCVTLLALQAPVARDLRIVVGVLRALSHVQRMGTLARHVAVMARFKHPNPMSACAVRSILARMSLLASQLADDAASAIEHQDPLSGCRLAITDDEVDTLLRHLFAIVLADDWPHGVEKAVDAALLGRYYERFGDHAVTIARQACYTISGGVSEPAAMRPAGSPIPSRHVDGQTMPATVQTDGGPVGDATFPIT